MQTESTIRFILDGEVVSVDNPDPTRSVLQYLREDLNRCGTKEGCAEGDCGACTVVVGDLVDGRLRLRSINACLLLIPMLHGRLLITVESLQQGSQSLHPVQQAMVDSHASQCGFCTPGFVMSLFALYKQQDHPVREQIEDALSGNLCRCTGYRPIIEAAETMHDLPPGDGPDWLYGAQSDVSQVADLVGRLLRIKPNSTLHIDHHAVQYFAPTTIERLDQLRKQYPEATLVAGNTDVGLWINKQLRDLPVMIHFGLVDELKHITVNDNEISIGAAVSLTDAFETLTDYFPALTDLFRQFASLPIRNAGTLAGNVANGSPIGDAMPALLVLDTEVILSSVSGKRRVALKAFYLGYQQKDMAADEWVEAVVIPKPSPNSTSRLASYKVSKRFDQDISAVCSAFYLELDVNRVIRQVRFAYGGMAAIPKRADNTEQVLLGKVWNKSALQLAMETVTEDFQPLSDLRASVNYRIKLAANLIRRFYLETTSGDDQPLNLQQISGAGS